MLGLDLVIWIVLAVYFAGMLLLGWMSRRGAGTQEGYLVGNRRFGVWYMIMHAFGAGTNPGDAAGVFSKTMSGGASGIWVSWIWLFGTPFYWLIAPLIRQLRCLTMADFYEQRFGPVASIVYIFMATVGMTVCLASVLLATTRTVQGMMGKAAGAHEESWFFGILLITTATFTLYGYWGGIVAAVKTDMIQGIMIIVLSSLAIPAALNLDTVGGLAGAKQTLAQHSASNGVDFLSLFDPSAFRPGVVLLLCISSPLSALALPHLVTVCGAGPTAWEGRMGITCGNILKRICTIGWTILALCWLAHLVKTGVQFHADAAFGNAIRSLLPTFLQGLMLACVLAAAMSSGDAFQVTVAGLFSQNIYKRYLRPDASDAHLLKVTKLTGVLIVGASLGVAIVQRDSVVNTIIIYFQILALVGISAAMGIVWRRMNSTGMVVATGAAVAVFLLCRYLAADVSHEAKIGLPMLAGVVVGIVVSLMTRAPDPEQIDRFYVKIFTPIGDEHMLDRPLDEVVPPNKRLTTAFGLFLVKPTRQSCLGFILTLLACATCVIAMAALLA